MDDITLPSHGSVKECKDRLAKHQKQVRSTYEDNKWEENKVIFRNEPEQPNTDALVIVEERLMYAVCSSKGQIIRIATQRNAIGLQADATTVKRYADNWNHIWSMPIVKREIAVCNNDGITLLSFETVMCKDIVENMVPRTCSAYKNGLLFTCKDDQKVYLWKDERVETFAGSNEKGSLDGTVAYARFHTPTGLCFEFDHAVYVTDYRFGSIRQITTLKHTASFLRALNKLIDAFFIHDKHRNYKEKTLEEALLHGVLTFVSIF